MLDGRLTSFELFAGAGGLALGTELAGFRSLGMIEWDKWACQTMRNNTRTGFSPTRDWRIYEMDVRDFQWSSLAEKVDLLVGGPPCQPFSLGGIAKAHEDVRDMFPAMIAAVRETRPRAFVVENVKGLLRSQFSDYYEYILLRLEFPERIIASGESWVEHLSRLRSLKEASSYRSSELKYDVVSTLVNAADYGVPQKRERVFIVGFRSDLNIKWHFPSPTHSLEALKWSQREGGEYWEKHGIQPESFAQKAKEPKDGRLPWRTVRDALVDLPDPKVSDNVSILNHEFKEGARIYPGHTGSMLDMPSKTLKAGVHGVPGGENMLLGDDGCPRYYTVREAARIQTFPDEYVLNGSWSEAMKQIGNAVPVLLARKVVASVAEALMADES